MGKMGVMLSMSGTERERLDTAAKALVAKYGSPFEAVKALMVYSGKLEKTLQDIATTYPDILRVSHEPKPPRFADDLR